MHDSFRLLAFNPYDDITSSEDSDKNEKEFVIQMFGINEKGETASIFVIGYTPFFYVKIGNNWNSSDEKAFVSQMSEDMGKYCANTIVHTKIINRKKLYGFDGGKEHKFLLVKFKNEAAMRKAKNLWYLSGTSHTGEYTRVLQPGGYEYNGEGTELYEAQIPPLLRMFHIKEISPSGWIAMPKAKTLKHKQKTTSCNYEYTIDYKHIIPLPNKEAVVPYKICSFDIEASSSHGDFPLPKKNYNKLATNIVDVWDNGPGDAKYLKQVIKTAFGCADNIIGDVDTVYPKTKICEDDINMLFDRWIKICPSTYKEQLDDDGYNANDIDGEGACDEGLNETGAEESGGGWTNFKNMVQGYKKRGSIIDLLSDSSASRETQILELTRTLTNTFPRLHGDNVTCIGSTFLRYGDKKPYLNHCVIRDTCSKLPHTENSVVESYKTEKEVLLAWTKIIQKEDPDIIIGYNIFGFDYQFMFLRAKELGCVNSFMQLSRNKREVCLKKDWKTGKEGLEENTIFIASGQHDIKFVKMNGRLQIDLYNFVRRDYQLTMYKLDYVSGYFIGDNVAKIEHVDDMTKIYSKNLTGLEVGSYVNFEESAHSVDSYKDGKKFIISNINVNDGTFMIPGKEALNMSKKVRWGLAKDDVTPQDLFRMANEGPDERAIMAKYCIQDCNLLHHLMRKIDVMTGYIEMSSLCSVPMDFIVMRGQGIKLTSYIAKKCREKGTLMPVIDKALDDEGYEGAIVLPPKCDLYLEEPVACVDYSSLYPSSMISENISHDSKVLTREYDLEGNLLKETGEKDDDDNYIYDNLEGYEYVNITYDTYKWQRKGGREKAGKEKVKVGYKECRFAQFPDGLGIMPAILEELLAARKATRKLIPLEKDDFMKNILDKRQQSIKVTANSMYGQTGAKTSSFYEKDCAASTTAIGRKLLTYGKRVI